MSELLDQARAMAHESRLRLLGHLAKKAWSVEQLADLLELRGPTVSHHLSVLRKAGLVELRQEGSTHWYQLDPTGLDRMRAHLASPEQVSGLAPTEPSPGAPGPEDAWERKVLANFVRGEALKEIPASLKKRQVILNWLVEHFERDRRYSEKEVSERIARHHPDFATLRRELILSKLMAREDGVYWRLPPREPSPASAES